MGKVDRKSLGQEGGLAPAFAQTIVQVLKIQAR